MDPNILVGIIGAIATVCAPLIGMYAAKWMRSRNLKAISKQRQAALVGEWEGTAHQEVGPKGPLDANVKVTFEVSGKEVLGEMLYQYELDGNLCTLELTLSGGFLFDRYLRLQYENKKATVIQFGSIVGELSGRGTSLSGRFIGYGSITVSLVWGSLELKKQA